MSLDESEKARLNNEAEVPSTNVEIKNLTKTFEDDEGEEVFAVDDLSIDIYEGEFLVIVGPSGCGKTTTLRTVAGLETATEGHIEINESDVTGLDPRERDIAMVFQNYALYPHKTVRDNLAFPLQIRKFPSEEIEARVEETASLLEIEELLDRKPGALSGGQQQRVALGRALVREPSVFLMDEPLSNLDAKLRLQMRTELNELHKKVGKTTIYVTHDQAEAMTLGDRVAVMNHGELQQIGDPQQLYDNPVNRFVAGFIGEPLMNFIPVEIMEMDDGYKAEGDLFSFTLPEFANQALDQWTRSFDSISLGIRPEDLHDVKVNEDHDDVFEAYVKIIEPMGSDNFLTITPPNEQDSEYTARVAAESTAREEKSITLGANLSKAHLFDNESGKTITHPRLLE